MDNEISLAVRVLLITGSLLTVVLMLRRIRSSRVQIRDSIFWILFSALLIVLSVVPELGIWAAQALGIESPINFVFLVIIFLLLIQLFLLNVRISQLENRLRTLAQHIALEQRLTQEQEAAEGQVSEKREENTQKNQKKSK